MGSGGLFFDYDNDGSTDIFLVDRGSLAHPAVAHRARHRLFHNRGDGTFDDSSERSGIRHRDYGMGACAGDYDGDGRMDLYITNFGPNMLYRNAGNGAFTDVQARPGRRPEMERRLRLRRPRPRRRSRSLGDNYVAADRQESVLRRPAGPRFYCHPLKYDPLPNTLYRNDGGRQFTDVSAASGVGALTGNGMGVVVADFNEDGWPDVFVANDSLPNFLFRNDRISSFTETALAAGVAVATDGMPRAGMGIDTGDYDADGRMDLVVTNLDFQMHTLLPRAGQGLFGNATTTAGSAFRRCPSSASASRSSTSTTTHSSNIAIVNGHVLDNAPQFRAGSTYPAAEAAVPERHAAALHGSRGQSMGADLHRRRRSGAGWPPATSTTTAISTCSSPTTARPPTCCATTAAARNALLVRLRGSRSNVDGRRRAHPRHHGARTQLRDVKAGSSYLSQNDLRAHFGLGSATTADRIEVQWPTGESETLKSVAANQIVTIQQGAGVVERTPLAGKR